jgi:hypothetical protein
MTSRYLLAALAVVAGPACAQDIKLKPLFDGRLRYETVDQAGVGLDANAVTLRLRAGVSATSGPWSALAEGQGTVAIVNDYFDGLHGAATRPIVADPENLALYRAQLQYKTKPLTVTLGRQRIALDDERFVGAVGFRQNGQTFDAVRAEWMPLKGVKADLSYAWSDRTIWGNDGSGARQQAVSGDNLFANLAVTTPAGLLSGFAYLVDQDEAAMQGFRLSSQSYGVRLAGSRALSKNAKLSWAASYARQSDYHRNPNDYRADYYLVDGTLDVAQWKLNAGYEVLGADKGAALTSFQTPLATLFKFQGWADKFLTTPPNGVRDLYAGAGWSKKKLGKIDVLTLQATAHRFRSDRLGQHYGREIDLLASAKVGRTVFAARFADYRARQFATDTRKFWLSVDWAL